MENEDMQNNAEWLEAAVIEIVREASLLPEIHSFRTMQKDGFANIVTSADMAVQDFLCRRLKELLPDSGFICEEKDIRDVAHQDVWIIDPIDGTANFSRGLSPWGICVGLRRNRQMEVGVVYLPATDEMFSAHRDGGARRNGEAIHVSERSFANSLLFTALPLYHKENAAECGRLIADFFAQGNDVRRLGAAAPELCYLAMGRGELFFEYLLSPWDFAAASLIVQEAGGVIGSRLGSPLLTDGASGVLAANSVENFSRLVSLATAHFS